MQEWMEMFPNVMLGFTKRSLRHPATRADRLPVFGFSRPLTINDFAERVSPISYPFGMYAMTMPDSLSLRKHAYSNILKILSPKK